MLVQPAQQRPLLPRYHQFQPPDAKAQAVFIKDMIDNNFFSEEEMSIIRRARNYKSNSHPKNCDIVTYKHATALEAIIGYHELLNNKTRIDEIMNNILGE